MRQKIVVAAVLAAMLLGIVGCASPETTPAVQQTPQVVEKVVKETVEVVKEVEKQVTVSWLRSKKRPPRLAPFSLPALAPASRILSTRAGSTSTRS